MERLPPREFANYLRRNATEPERQLWQILRAHRLGGLKFRRQMPIDSHILDFVCLRARLIVEADGSQHADDADRARDAHFAAITIQICNNDIIHNPDGVALEILRVAEERLR